MGIFDKVKDKIRQIIFFDEVSYRDQLSRLESECPAWNEQTVPFLQDIGFLNTPDDIDQVRHISRLDIEECYKYLLDFYLNKFGRGAYNVHKFYDTAVSYNLAYWNKDGKTVTWICKLTRFPGGVNEDLVSLRYDENTNNIEAAFDSEALRTRLTYSLEGAALKGYERAQNLCNLLQDISQSEPFVLNSLVYLDEAGKWKVRKDITYSKLVSVGQ